MGAAGRKNRVYLSPRPRTTATSIVSYIFLLRSSKGMGCVFATRFCSGIILSTEKSQSPFSPFAQCMSQRKTTGEWGLEPDSLAP